MNPAERERRREDYGRKIRRRQALDGHDSPFPAFLNVVTDALIDIESRLDHLEQRIKNLDRKSHGWGNH